MPEKILVCVVENDVFYVFTPETCKDNKIDLGTKKKFAILETVASRLVHHLVEGVPRYGVVVGSVKDPFPQLTHFVFWFPEQGEFSPEDFAGKVFCLDQNHFTRVQRRAIRRAYQVALQQSFRACRVA